MEKMHKALSVVHPCVSLYGDTTVRLTQQPNANVWYKK